MRDLLQLCNEAEGLVLFDMDGTLFDGDLGEACHFILFASKLTNKGVSELNRADILLLSMHEKVVRYVEFLTTGQHTQAYAYTLSFLESFSAEMIEEAVIKSFELAQQPIVLHPHFSIHTDERVGFLPELQRCLRLNKEVYIVSASPKSVHQRILHSCTLNVPCRL